ncbi:MAG: hypothetical protein U1F77_02895 [Kiritimatiellia bacterium]
MNTAAPKCRTWPAPAAGLLLALVLVNVCVAAYVSAERTIYFWDFANYWNLFDHYTRLLRDSPMDALRELVGSIRYSEYNGIAAFLLAPWAWCSAPAASSTSSGWPISTRFPPRSPPPGRPRGTPATENCGRPGSGLRSSPPRRRSGIRCSAGLSRWDR